MKLNFSPMRRNDTLVLDRCGDRLIVNGETFDFGPLEEGSSLPAQAIGSPWFAGPVSRRDGVLELTVILPHGPNASRAQLSPAPLELISDGPVALPTVPTVLSSTLPTSEV